MEKEICRRGLFLGKTFTIRCICLAYSSRRTQLFIRVQKRKLEEYYAGTSKSVTVGVGIGIGMGLDLDPGPTLDILHLFRKISNGPSLDLDFDSSP